MNRIKQLAINEEGFVFDPLTGDSFTVNQTGLFILQKLKEGKETEQIVKELTEEFEVSQEEAERDLIDFVEKLRSYRLL
ncbi:HPr-rel-A system PqqD family peptide chaperone [Persephonella atlantica]|uniref:HPr-rel-A system PqqD family peptide chaperone n=1 Tax=Persephonella atlantica TaxID=2699429 RepID=A0ABS1GK45_9AQUI|nr:HPr-rel-A system PqqD family peptide chaperone [Persephonella atlantica]MBK3333287.1 HPr-rel-A system PqqD family peptide chaperone [Persephonella atlantica]